MLLRPIPESGTIRTALNGCLHGKVLAFSFLGKTQYKYYWGSKSGRRVTERVVTASGGGQLDTVWVSYRLGTVGDSARSCEITGALGLRWVLLLG